MGINNDVLEAYEHSKSVLQQLGHTLKEIDFSELSSGICSYYVIAPASVLPTFQGLMELNMVIDQTKIIFPELYMKTRSEGFGDEVKKEYLLEHMYYLLGFTMHIT